MSKSKRNTVDPDDIIGAYGADTARWFMPDSPPERDVNWTEEGVQENLALRATALAPLVHEAADVAAPLPGPDRRNSASRRWRCARPRTAPSRASRKDVERLRFNVCVAHIYEFANALQTSLTIEAEPLADYRWAVREAAEILVRLFHPMMPHLAGSARCARAQNPGRRRALAGPGARPADRGNDHTSGPNQWQEARRCHSRQKCAEYRDRECRFGARCGKTGIDGRPPKRVIVVPQRIVNVVA